jgi:hypothetical protein
MDYPPEVRQLMAWHSFGKVALQRQARLTVWANRSMRFALLASTALVSVTRRA